MIVVYRILRAADFARFESSGVFHGSADDKRDGFIHFSAQHQVAGTLAKHYAGAEDLVLLSVDAAVLGDDLRWEVSRGGDQFPHLYRALLWSEIKTCEALPLMPDGSRALAAAFKA